VKITFNENAAPHLRGTTAHVPPALAASLVATGFAEACPAPRRGSKEWLEHRLEQSRRAAPLGGSFFGVCDDSVDPSGVQRNQDDKFKTEPPNFPFTKK
jgi:hypothetical protein